MNDAMAQQVLADKRQRILCSVVRQGENVCGISSYHAEGKGDG